MSIATVEEFQARGLGEELSQVAGDPQTGEVDLSVFGRAARDADAVINPVLANLPAEAKNDPLITMIAVNLTRYNLYPQGATPRAKEDNAAALSLLRQIARGEISLGVPPAPAAVAADNPLVYAGETAFGSAEMERY